MILGAWLRRVIQQIQLSLLQSKSLVDGIIQVVQQHAVLSVAISHNCTQATYGQMLYDVCLFSDKAMRCSSY